MNKKEISKKKKESLKKNGTLNPHPERISDDGFLEGHFFDPNDLLQVKYEMIRKVEQENFSVTKTTSMFGFSRPSFYRLQETFQKDGLSGLFPKKKGPQDAHKLSAEIMDFLHIEIEKDKSLKARSLKKIIEKRFGLIVHIRSIERALSRRKKKKKN